MYCHCGSRRNRKLDKIIYKWLIKNIEWISYCHISSMLRNTVISKCKQLRFVCQTMQKRKIYKKRIQTCSGFIVRIHRGAISASNNLGSLTFGVLLHNMPVFVRKNRFVSYTKMCICVTRRRASKQFQVPSFNESFHVEQIIFLNQAKLSYCKIIFIRS